MISNSTSRLASSKKASQLVSSTYGDWVIIAEENAITQLHFLGSQDNINVDANPNPITQEAANQLKMYFLGQLKEFNLNLKPEGTPFQQSVWLQVEKVTYGTTSSYKTLAQKIGNQGAVRAVGAANGKNPIPIIIPCHRVIASSGSLQGYALGLELKKALLVHEQTHSDHYLF